MLDLYTTIWSIQAHEQVAKYVSAHIIWRWKDMMEYSHNNTVVL